MILRGKTIPAAIICITSLTWNGVGSKPGLHSDLLQSERLSLSPSFETGPPQLPAAD